MLEDHACDAGTGTCQRLPEPLLTWWENCPEGLGWACPGLALASMDDMMNCIESGANHLVDEMLRLQFPGNGGADWCP